MRRFATLVCVFTCLFGPMMQQCRANVLDDVNDTLTK